MASQTTTIDYGFLKDALIWNSHFQQGFAQRLSLAVGAQFVPENTAQDEIHRVQIRKLVTLDGLDAHRLKIFLNPFRRQPFLEKSIVSRKAGDDADVGVDSFIPTADMSQIAQRMGRIRS